MAGIRDFIEEVLPLIDPDLTVDDPAVDRYLVQPLQRMFAEEIGDLDGFFRDILSSQGYDTTDAAPIVDVLARPAAVLLAPIIAQIGELRRFLGMGEDPEIVPRDLAELLLSNLRITSLADGDRARYLVRCLLAEPSDIDLDEATTFTSTAGLRYTPYTEVQLTQETVEQQTQGTLYYFDVSLQAETAGGGYNLSVGARLTAPGTPVVATEILLQQVVGTDEETVAAFVDRVDTLLKEQSLVTKPGILRYMLSEFGSTNGIRVMGTGDTGFVRDLATVAYQGPTPLTPLEVFEDLEAVAEGDCPFLGRLARAEGDFVGVESGDAIFLAARSRIVQGAVGDDIRLTDYALLWSEAPGGLAQRQFSIGGVNVVLNHTDEYQLSSSSAGIVARDVVCVPGDTQYEVRGIAQATTGFRIYPTLDIRGSGAYAVTDVDEDDVSFVVPATLGVLLANLDYISTLQAEGDPYHGTIAVPVLEEDGTYTITATLVGHDYEVEDTVSIALYRKGLDPTHTSFVEDAIIEYEADVGPATIIRPALALGDLVLLSGLAAEFAGVHMRETAPESMRTIVTGRKPGGAHAFASVNTTEDVHLGGAVDVVYAPTTFSTGTLRPAFSDGINYSTPLEFDAENDADLITGGARYCGTGVVVGASVVAITFDDPEVTPQWWFGTVVEIDGSYYPVLARRGDGSLVLQDADLEVSEESVPVKVYTMSILRLRAPGPTAYAGTYSTTVGWAHIEVADYPSDAPTPTQARFISTSGTTVAAVTGVDLGSPTRVFLSGLRPATVTVSDDDVVILSAPVSGASGAIAEVTGVAVNGRELPYGYPRGIVVKEIREDGAARTLTVEEVNDDGDDTTLVFVPGGDLDWVQSGYYVTKTASSYGLPCRVENDRDLLVLGGGGATFSPEDEVVVGPRHAVLARFYMDDGLLGLYHSVELLLAGRGFVPAAGEIRAARYDGPLAFTEGDPEGSFEVQAPDLALTLRNIDAASTQPKIVVSGAVVVTSEIADADLSVTGMAFRVLLGSTYYDAKIGGINPVDPEDLRAALERQIPGLHVRTITGETGSYWYLWADGSLTIQDSALARFLGIVDDTNELTDEAEDYTVDLLLDGEGLLATPVVGEGAEGVYSGKLYVTAQDVRLEASGSVDYGMPYADVLLQAVDLSEQSLADAGVVVGSGVTLADLEDCGLPRGFWPTTVEAYRRGTTDEEVVLVVPAAVPQASGAMVNLVGETLVVSYATDPVVDQIQSIMESRDRALFTHGAGVLARPLRMVFASNPTALSDTDFIAAARAVLGETVELSDLVQALYRRGARFVSLPLRALVYGLNREMEPTAFIADNVITANAYESLVPELATD